MERAISHDDAARTSILKPEEDGYRKGRREIEERGQKRGRGEKKKKALVCVRVSCVSNHALLIVRFLYECI